ncbi:inactive pancreatic lipase-related protein 1-like [Plodia interpunctella]|uniref:inactive pancreatic lipase-related protein 1-like n=1 Tax=Plodia interpunctella TaxID=58824 RepID=UPI0023675CE1|nr:inactive pancreatic lipase-related protein 1-like [Plodia interpunctella]
MWKGVSVVFAIALVLANGEPVPRNQKNGEFSRYYLYNSNVTGVPLLQAGPAATDLKEDVPTVVLVHGHGGSYLTSLNLDVRRELLESEDVNVIVVDWSIYASMTYAQAQAAVLSVAQYLANALRNNDVPPGSLHLVGFNLGAHIAGIAGRLIGGVARVTGLDPSQSPIKLSITDAKYVEVIHTDASGTVLSNGIGEKLGHADFYPNGGRTQPGCANNECHHNRAWLYFAASIRDKTFNANCCSTISEKDSNTCRLSTLPMGTNRLSKTPCLSGIYRVNTGNTYPF